MVTVNLKLIAHRLFEDPKIVAKLRRDYRIDDGITDPAGFADALVASFGQIPDDADSWDQPKSNATVFRAAVRALASNSRAWSFFLQYEEPLRVLLADYNPVSTLERLETGRLDVAAIKACLPGQTSTGDVQAITRWAVLLAQDLDYYGVLTKLRRDFFGVRRCERRSGSYGRSVSGLPISAAGAAEAAADWVHPGGSCREWVQSLAASFSAISDGAGSSLIGTSNDYLVCGSLT